MEKKLPNLMPALYSHRLAEIQEIARDAGYAIAVHGSMKRDLDLSVIPPNDCRGHENITQFKAALLLYGDHLADCNVGQESCECDCGFEDIWMISAGLRKSAERGKSK